MLGIASGAIAVGLAGCVGGQSEDDEHDDTGSHSHDADDAPTESSQNESHGGNESHGHDATLEGPSETAEVAMASTDSGQHFDPHVVWVETGGSVTWTNESGSHSTTAYHADNGEPHLAPDGATAWDSGVLSEQGGTFEHTFDTEGVYHYYCTPHETSGMIGSVIVGEPDPNGQPALADPPSDKPDAVRQKLTSLNDRVTSALGGDTGSDDGGDRAGDSDGHGDHGGH
ncbi:cupredoxin domain-containing protein [Natrinema marinum]|uniref:cupredoxin domain-containing protein n=1 Tax=Natrinema marinum TaxID=2961598 RepID=UPI0020C8895E|nr:plastocyanin/azurin family copper-binding protein [Natrinema marinum]